MSVPSELIYDKCFLSACSDGQLGMIEIFLEHDISSHRNFQFQRESTCKNIVIFSLFQKKLNLHLQFLEFICVFIISDEWKSAKLLEQTLKEIIFDGSKGILEVILDYWQQGQKFMLFETY